MSQESVEIMQKKLSLPQGLSTWLTENNWQLAHATQIVGGYAATLFRLHLYDQKGMPRRAIYKMVAANRAQEVNWYRNVFAQVPELIPEVFGYVKNDSEEGILMEDCGVTVKSFIKDYPPHEQTAWLQNVLRWLGDMHINYETQLPALVKKGLLATYPVHSSVTWANLAIAHIKKLAEASTPMILLTRDDADQVAAMSEWFYPRYAQWLRGRVTLTHGDPHLENIVVEGDRFRLIDWEATCAAIPQRDLAILLQDVLIQDQNATLQKYYFSHLGAHGWDVNTQEFIDSFQAVYFDNTLMMLGWEINKYREGYLSRDEITGIVNAKLQWLRMSYAQLR